MTPGITSPEVSGDGLSLYLRVEPLGRFDSDVYVSRRDNVNAPWGVAQPIDGFATLDRWESHPAISKDQLSLFLEDTVIEQTNYDLRGYSDMVVAVRSDINQRWSKPINLGDTINAAKSTYNTRPFLTADGSTLYFDRIPDTSNGPINRTSDIYQASVLPFLTESMAGDGSSYGQSFDVLGTDASQPFLPIPRGWTFTANDVVFNNVTTRKFPTTARPYAGVYNAGADGAADRSLVTDVTTNEAGELDFRALVTGEKLQALRLGFDIEAWQVRVSNAEAAFHVVLEADSGNGFQPVADLGEFSTGKTLSRPATGNVVDGNDPAYRHSFDTGPIDVGSIPVGATLRTRWIGTAGSRNVVFGLDNVSLRFAAPGDANIDGAFNSGDLVHVFQVGEYEDNIAGNSTWSDGDWTSDHEFDSSDLVAAFQAGQYEPAGAASSSVPEPTGWVLALIGMTLVATRRRTRK
jgi:hypothetical protein